MGFKHTKDRTRLLAEGQLRLDERNHYGRPHYVSLYLWADSVSLLAASDGRFLASPVEDGTTAAMCCHAPERIAVHADGTETACPPPKLLELHFVSKEWNYEVVAHECAHGAIGISRHLGPARIDDPDTDSEEVFCYRLGKLANTVMWWLDDKDV